MTGMPPGPPGRKEDSSGNVLDVRNMGKTFRLHERQTVLEAFQEVSFQVRSGGLTALAGPSGSGKSSVLKCIYRTYLPTAGQVLYRPEGDPVVDLAQLNDYEMIELRRRGIGFVTQFLHCLPRQPALEVVARPQVARGVRRSLARQQASELLRRLAVPEHLWELPPATFSGGEKQRVNIARGLIGRPRLLLLDEPTASLDGGSADRVLAELQASRDKGASIVAVFHDPVLLSRWPDAVVELAQAVPATH